MERAAAGVGTSALGFLFVAAVAGFGIWQVRPPDAVPPSAPANVFSSARALNHLRAFAREPHPVGSAAHDRVRDYIASQIAAMGLQPLVETTPVAMDARWGFPLSAATVSNVVARVPGTANTQALALVCHYDSVPSGPGASDDGEGVAVLLETLCALRAGPPLRNDLIFLFTDGEEAGLLGAKAFVDAHPADAGLVLDFEARGTSGPAFMFETSEGNGWIVRQFAEAAPYPQANSLSYEAYRNMPNDTDLTIFKKAGIAGLNFAFIGDVTNYHSRLDDVRHIDERSLQHQGSYALSLARRFGSLDLRHVKASNVTYFNFPGVRMVIYPIEWSLPLALIAAALLAAVVGLGLARRRLSAGGMLLGFLVFLLALVATAAAVAGLWRLVLAWHPGYRQMLQGDPYHAGVYRAACTALAIAAFTAFYNWLRRRIDTANLWAGALAMWLTLALVSAIYLPGASYIFTWPLLFGIVGLAFRKVTAVVWACAIPGLLLVAPMIDQLFVAMTMRLAALPALITALLLGLLIPHLELIARPGRWWLPGVAALACAGCLIAGSATSRFDRDHPKPDSLFYGLDADSGTATWFSGDVRPDPWTVPALSARPRRESASPFLPFLTWNFLVHDAPAEALPAPVIEKVEDSTGGGVRTLRLRIASRRNAPAVFVYGDPHAEVLAAQVNGKPLGTGKLAPADKPGLRVIRFRRWSFVYENPPRDGIELRMQVRARSAPLEMEVIDETYGLGELPTAPTRPNDTMPLAWKPNSVFVRKSYSF